MPQTGSARRHGAEDLRRRDDHAAAHDLLQTRLRLRPVMILQAAAERHRAPHQPQAAADRRELHEQFQHLVHQIHSRTPPHRNGTATAMPTHTAILMQSRGISGGQQGIDGVEVIWMRFTWLCY